MNNLMYFIVCILLGSTAEQAFTRSETVDIFQFALVLIVVTWCIFERTIKK